MNNDNCGNTGTDVIADVIGILIAIEQARDRWLRKIAEWLVDNQPAIERFLRDINDALNKPAEVAENAPAAFDWLAEQNAYFTAHLPPGPLSARRR